MVGTNLRRIAHLAAGQRLYDVLRAAKQGRAGQGGQALMSLWNELSSPRQTAYAAAGALAQLGPCDAETCYSVFVLNLPAGVAVTAWADLPLIDQQAWATAAEALRPKTPPKECP